ncbi:MAG: hypothetical protein LBV06_06860 [Propionibacteriaceae bacterium]|nr:hypothetical protein [Propionibacteriaceae bacterium]
MHLTEIPPRHRRRRAARDARIVTTVIIAVVVVIALIWWGVGAIMRQPGPITHPAAANPARTTDVASTTSGSTTLDSVRLNSSNAMLVSLDAPTTPLLELNADQRIYPASLTKIMTALVVLDWVDDLQAMVTVPASALRQVADLELSTAGFVAGETVPIEDLLYGLLLPSGGECALTLAQWVAGDEDSFAGLMNTKAAELGMTGSHFVNTTGSHDPDHYSTIHDLIRLLETALNNSAFFTVFTSHSHTTTATDDHPDGLTVVSTIFRHTDGVYPDFTLLGAKTGHTEHSGQCLASLAEKNGRRYVLVTAGADTIDNLTDLKHLADAVTVYSAV